jgi:hypothetical protein
LRGLKQHGTNKKGGWWMGKDPAVLWYTADFLIGTSDMTDEQVGKYTRLLCNQHQKGHLTKKQMMQICITHDEDIFSKFILDENKFYYNERMDFEIHKRQNYSESRSLNRLGKNKPKDMKNICNSYENHMENENENINKDISNKVSKKDKVIRHKYGSYQNVLLSDEDYQKLISEFPADHQERIERLSEYMESKGATYKSHLATIRNWAKRDKPSKPKEDPYIKIMREEMQNEQNGINGTNENNQPKLPQLLQGRARD